ncbi:large subunit ribosomal protein L35 [Salibacterium salarium]|uniref:Large ribosomal subunit protein bL35 n=1 Tax=Salibacterium salarium TaxID=284579 RepID=A0A428N171_9BACI|nr:50S ribosomal protein L35 [Salibacterium salarium]MDQ0298608.1 large subunit ribosomal protein L35 [Salibacterium salarium]RSL32204.1 50S ribosomal protein L35 [Salibacterium salarium]
MPKMKTHRGAAKRFRRTGSGKLKRSHAFTSHLFRNKSKDQKRDLSKPAMVDKTDQKRIDSLLPNSKY